MNAPPPAEPPSRLRRWARNLKRDITACGLALRHPGTPWYAKCVLAATLAYAISPIDLIPDVIPVLGLLDDLLIVPLGLWLALRLIPVAVIDECRQQAGETRLQAPWLRRCGLAAVIALWGLMITILVWWYLRQAAA
jgi:uncharacterized membrane protein YkvA (DUF1232 family)